MSPAQATPPPVSPSHAESSSRARGTPPTHFPHFILHPIPTSFTHPHTVSRPPGQAQTHPRRSRPISRWRWNHVHRIPTSRPNSSHTTRQNNLQHKITIAVSIAKPGTTTNRTAPPSRPRTTFRTIAPRSPYSARASTCLRSESLAGTAPPPHPAHTPVPSPPHPPPTDLPQTARSSTASTLPTPNPFPRTYIMSEIPSSSSTAIGYRKHRIPSDLRS